MADNNGDSNPNQRSNNPNPYEPQPLHVYQWNYLTLQLREGVELTAGQQELFARLRTQQPPRQPQIVIQRPREPDQRQRELDDRVPQELLEWCAAAQQKLLESQRQFSHMVLQQILADMRRPQQPPQQQQQQPLMVVQQRQRELDQRQRPQQQQQWMVLPHRQQESNQQRQQEQLLQGPEQEQLLLRRRQEQEQELQRRQEQEQELQRGQEEEEERHAQSFLPQRDEESENLRAIGHADPGAEPVTKPAAEQVTEPAAEQVPDDFNEKFPVMNPEELRKRQRKTRYWEIR